MSTWQERLKAVVGSRGYDNCMRRSLQSVILYEAKRCISPRLPSLRPFQRKLAFLDQAKALVDSLDFLFPHQKEEILWRTATSKESLQPEVSWKRVKLIEKELGKLAEKMKPIKEANPTRTHDECVNLLVHELFEQLNGQKGDSNPTDVKPVPPNWEHAHNHVVMAFRLYYSYDQLDPTFPDAVPPREIVVPADKPLPKNSNGQPLKAQEQPYYLHMSSQTSASVAAGKKAPPGAAAGEVDPDEARRLALKEVREHLDILKEFEGMISAEEMAKRKRDLFMALPPAPPPAAAPSGDMSPNKKYKSV